MESFTELHRKVQQATDAGMGIDEIDATIITPASVSQDEKSALWLVAFGELDRGAQHQVVRESVAMLRPRLPALN